MTDPLSRWDGYRVIRGLHLQADGPQDCTLTLDLAEQMSGGRSAVLVFRGVADLHVGQLAGGVLQIDSLVSQILDSTRPDGVRLRILDCQMETIHFLCRSFCVRDEGAMQQGNPTGGPEAARG